MKTTRILSIVIILTIGCLNITASPSLQNNSKETKNASTKEGYNPEKLKNCIWECNHSAFMFTDSFMLIQRYNFEIPKITKVHYYLSNNLKDSFNLSKVSRNGFGRFILITHKWENFLGYYITSLNQDSMSWEDIFEDPSKQIGGPSPEYSLYKISMDSHPTLRLKAAFLDFQSNKSAQKQHNYFAAFPYDWHSYIGVFGNGRFGQENMSSDVKTAVGYLKHIPVINRQDYINKIINISIEAHHTGTPADCWLQFVSEELKHYSKQFNQLLAKRSKIQQMRFWQFIKSENNCLAQMPNSSAIIKGNVWHKTEPVEYRRILFLNDTCLIYNNYPSSAKSSSINSIQRGHVSDYKHIGDTLYFKEPEPGFQNDSKYYPQETSLALDSFLLYVHARRLNNSTEVTSNIEQRIYFEAFPQNWDDFYALFLSRSTANRNFYKDADKYIHCFESLNVIPRNEYIGKMINICIGATPERNSARVFLQMTAEAIERSPQIAFDILSQKPPIERQLFWAAFAEYQDKYPSFRKQFNRIKSIAAKQYKSDYRIMNDLTKIQSRTHR